MGLWGRLLQSASLRAFRRLWKHDWLRMYDRAVFPELAFHGVCGSWRKVSLFAEALAQAGLNEIVPKTKTTTPLAEARAVVRKILAESFGQTSLYQHQQQQQQQQQQQALLTGATGLCRNRVRACY